jgi:8-oxo-dGTP pyrophosphatase MutT (NUDIX family)
VANIDERSSVAYDNSQPGIHAGGGVLIFTQRGDLLIVKPNYRNTWAWPGCGWQPGESPQATAIRECREEINRVRAAATYLGHRATSATLYLEDGPIRLPASAERTS